MFDMNRKSLHHVCSFFAPPGRTPLRYVNAPMSQPPTQGLRRLRGARMPHQGMAHRASIGPCLGSRAVLRRVLVRGLSFRDTLCLETDMFTTSPPTPDQLS